MRKIVSAIVATLALMASPALGAVALQINSSGQLTGATGLSVRDPRFDGIVSFSTYDVAFVEGTCTSVFTGCDEDSDFALSDAGGDGLGAYYGAQALLDQVFTGIYDTFPALTFGCGAPTFCEAIIPFHTNLGTMFAAVADNSSTDDAITSPGYSTSFDTTNGPIAYANTTVYARFTLAEPASVPELATWAMMLLGFGAIGLQMRRKDSGPICTQAA